MYSDSFNRRRDIIPVSHTLLCYNLKSQNKFSYMKMKPVEYERVISVLKNLMDRILKLNKC